MTRRTRACRRELVTTSRSTSASIPMMFGALNAFVAGAERLVDLADVNCRVFVNNVSLGVCGNTDHAKKRTCALPSTGTCAHPTLGTVDPVWAS